MISKSFLFQNWIPKRNKKSLIYKKVLISIDTRCWKKFWFLPNFWAQIFSRIRIWVDIKETESNQALITHKQHLKNSRFNKSKRNKKTISLFRFTTSQQFFEIKLKKQKKNYFYIANRVIACQPNRWIIRRGTVLCHNTSSINGPARLHDKSSFSFIWKETITYLMCFSWSPNISYFQSHWRH